MSEYQSYLASREWAVKRESVLRRNGGRCERCNVFNASHVHHKTYARKFNERPEDLQGLCQPCHDFISAKSAIDPRAACAGFSSKPNPTYTPKKHENDPLDPCSPLEHAEREMLRWILHRPAYLPLAVNFVGLDIFTGERESLISEGFLECFRRGLIPADTVDDTTLKLSQYLDEISCRGKLDRTMDVLSDLKRNGPNTKIPDAKVWFFLRNHLRKQRLQRDVEVARIDLDSANGDLCAAKRAGMREMEALVARLRGFGLDEVLAVLSKDSGSSVSVIAAKLDLKSNQVSHALDLLSGARKARHSGGLWFRADNEDQRE